MDSSVLRVVLWSMGALLFVIGVIERRRKNPALSIPCLLIGICVFALGCLIL